MKIRPCDSCKFNVGVECDKKDNCDKCGWNPEVEKKRKENIRG